MAEDRVYSVQHIVMIEGAWHQATTDLIFRDGQPIAVLSWAGKPGTGHPVVSVPLDPEHLLELTNGVVDYVYQRPIQDPRQEPQKLD